MSGMPGREATTLRSPVLLTSLASAALGDGQGDLRYARESRGAVTEWGGVYGQLIRLTGPWTVELGSREATTDLPSCRVSESSFPGGWRSQHWWNDLTIVQELVAIPRPAGVVRRLSVQSESDREVPLTFTSRFSPYLFPVLVEGIRPLDFEIRTSAEDLAIRHQGFGLRVASTVAPSDLFLNRGSWIGGKYRGPVTEFASEHPVVVPPAGPPRSAGGSWGDSSETSTAPSRSP